MMRYTPEGIGEKIVAAAASINKLIVDRYDQEVLDANYSGAEPIYSTPEAILEALSEAKCVADTMTGHAGMYLRGMLDALMMHARLLGGEEVSYQEAMRVMQQVEIRPVPEDKIRMLSERVSQGLAERGYDPDLAKSFRKYLDDTAIAPDQVTTFAKNLIGKAKEACEKRVVRMNPGDGIDDVYSIENVFWSGLSRYLGNFRGDLTFNISRPWSEPMFANILCHEGYAGHQAFYSHWDDLYLKGELPIEGAFYLTAGNPANPMFEGAPETALHFLGWDDFDMETPEISDADKSLYKLGRDMLDLQRTRQEMGCYLYHVEHKSKEEVLAYMTEGGILTEVEAMNCFNFFTDPIQRYYYPCYYYGHWLVYECYEAVPVEKREAFFHLLYDYPHTNETLIAATSELIGRPIDPLKEW